MHDVQANLVRGNDFRIAGLDGTGIDNGRSRNHIFRPLPEFNGDTQ